MKIGIGSKNKTKVGALQAILNEYPIFSDAEVTGVDVESDQFGHPKNITETVEGAINRAKQAYPGHTYGFGIEGGLMHVPHTKSGYMEVAVCAIFDGLQIHLGISPALEWPTKAIDGILNKGLDGSRAMKEAGLTQYDKIGENEGMVGLLTRGRHSRTEYNRLAIMMALTHLENPEYF